MSRSGLRRRVTIVCIREYSAAIQQSLQTAFVQRLKPRQIIEPHLIDRKEQDELWLDRRNCLAEREANCDDARNQHQGCREENPCDLMRSKDVAAHYFFMRLDVVQHELIPQYVTLTRHA